MDMTVIKSWELFDLGQTLAGEMLRGMTEHDVPPRHLEHAWYTFDAVMDQGAYFEV